MMVEHGKEENRKKRRKIIRGKEKGTANGIGKRRR